MRIYEKEFKINAVNLYKSSGQSLKTLAEELGNCCLAKLLVRLILKQQNQ